MSVDLRTTYLGLELANPLVPSASTLSARIDNLKRLQDAGASAIVMQSLFEEQIEHEELQTHRVLETGAESFPEALSYIPDMEEYNTGPDEYLRHLEACKRELAIPVIGSLNGASEGGWIRYAKLIQDAGADALELNVYFIAADPDVSGTQVEQRYLELVLAVRESVTIPLAVKIGPYFSSMANMAGRFV
jgi:dihydroorotate dehydrogenase (fumarate)